MTVKGSRPVRPGSVLVVIIPLRRLVIAVLVATGAGVLTHLATDSYGWGGTATGLLFGLGSWPWSAGSGPQDDPVSAADATRATAASVSLACLTGAALPALVLTGAAAPSTSVTYRVLAAGVLAVALTPLGASRVPAWRGTTGVVLGLLAMVFGQLVASGATTTPRRVLGAAVVGVGWGAGAAAAARLGARAANPALALIPTVVVVLMGWLAVPAGPAVGILLPVVLLAVAMAAGVWAEAVPGAADLYLRNARRR